MIFLFFCLPIERLVTTHLRRDQQRHPEIQEILTISTLLWIWIWEIDLIVMYYVRIGLTNRIVLQFSKRKKWAPLCLYYKERAYIHHQTPWKIITARNSSNRLRWQHILMRKIPTGKELVIYMYTGWRWHPQLTFLWEKCLPLLFPNRKDGEI